MAFSDQPQFGITMFPTDYSIQPVALAKAVEERGLDSLYFPEHTHIPTSRATPFPGGGDLPEWYSHTHDPFVALAAAAAVTERIQLGTGICLVIQRDPIILAKECASLDMISNGRLVFGVGAGWNREEMENHGSKLPQTLGGGSGKGPCHEGYLDRRQSRVSWRMGRFRSNLVLPETSAGGWSSGLARCQLKLGIRSCRRVCRGLDAHRWP